MERFKDRYITQMNLEREALNKLYRLRDKIEKKYYINAPYIFKSDSPSGLQDCAYFWLSFKGYEVWMEKHPDRVIWDYRGETYVIKISGDQVLCGNTHVSSFSDFLQWCDRIRRMK